MKTPDYRTKRDILQHERWDPLIGDPNLASASVYDLRVLDDFLAFLETRKMTSLADLTVQEFVRFNGHRETEAVLRKLKLAMEAVFPGHPSVLTLEDAIRALGKKPARKTSNGRRRLSKSVHFDNLPLSWREAFDDMDAGFDRNGQLPPVTGMIATHKMKLRQLLCSARTAGLPDELSVETVRAYARDLRSRELAPATLRASFVAVQKFARYIATDDETLELLADLTRVYETKAHNAKSKKFEHLQNTGYSPVELVKQAHEILSGVAMIHSPRSKQERRNRAAALALFSVMPVRLADTRFVFGETIFWTGEHYTVETVLSKSGYPWTTDIDPRLNVFIDALILRGCDPIWLEQMREECLADKRALFITMTGEPVAYGYVSDRWRAAVGTGEHIARTILHTFLGIELGQEGTDMAMAANGQRHHGTAKAYQDDALAMAQRMKGQTELTNVAQDGDLTMFEFK